VFGTLRVPGARCRAEVDVVDGDWLLGLGLWAFLERAVLRLDEDVICRPFVMVTPSNAPSLVWPPTWCIRYVDPQDAENADFCRAMNRLNCLGYDGVTHAERSPTSLGMPPWVMLDCCLLPSAIFGFEVARSALPMSLSERLDPGGTQEMLGVSEYIALPALQPGEVVGISLVSLASGLGLATRTKALGLWMLGARTHIGVAQYASVSLRTHLRFGLLEVVDARPAIHSLPHETFVYRLSVPSAPVLRSLAAGGRGEDARGKDDEQTWDESYTFDPRDRQAVNDFVARTRSSAGSWYICACGPVVTGELSAVTVARAAGR